MIYSYDKQVNTDGLEKEIRDSGITIGLVGITQKGVALDIEFKAPLSESEQLELDSIVSNHDPSKHVKLRPLGVEVTGPIVSKPFTDADGFRFRGASFIENVSANSTKEIDYLISDERYINGGRLIVKNMGEDDKITFQVVDKDGIFGFGPMVLDQFITDFYLPAGESLEVALDYPARIVAGLYLRLIYTNTNSIEASVKCNLYLHWKAQ